MLLCDSESLRREWEGKIKLLVLLITPVLVASRAGVELHAEAGAYSKHSLFHTVRSDDCCKKSCQRLKKPS